jgi:hypothetical protein
MLIYKSNRVNGRKYVLRQWLLVTLVIKSKGNLSLVFKNTAQSCITFLHEK